MKTILLEELDPRMSEWLREVIRHEQVMVTEHGTPFMTLTPASAIPLLHGTLQNRILLPEFAAIMNGLGCGGTDSAQIISEERDREVG